MTVDFEISIRSGNEALISNPVAEIHRILDRVKDDLVAEYDGGPIVDMNGNKIGEWSFTTED